MNILLIKPSSKYVYGAFPPSIQIPLGLGYIAAVLEEGGHKVSVFDMDMKGQSNEKHFHLIKKKDISAVGITCTTPTYTTTLEICNQLKKLFPDIITILGGIQATILPEEAVMPNSIDFVVIREGEITILELIDTIEKGGNISKIRGIAYKSHGKVIINRPREFIKNLDEIPFPAWHLFSRKYTYPDSLYKKTFPIITSRGCPGKCSFCNNNMGRKFRSRSAKNVADEIEFLVHSYHAKEIHIWDDNFTTNKKRIFQIRDEIKSRKLEVKFAFPNGIRADFLSEEILLCLKDMGTYSISLGIESGNQKILERAGKEIKLKKVNEIINIAKSLKMETWAFFIIGLPGETKETIMDTIQFAIDIDPHIAKFHILKPYPGTRVFNELKRQRLLLFTDYNQFGIHTPPVHELPPDLQPEDMVRFQKLAYRRFYLRPRKIMQQLQRLRTLNRIRLNINVGIALLREITTHCSGVNGFC